MFEGLRKRLSEAVKGFVKSEERAAEQERSVEEPKAEEQAAGQPQAEEPKAEEPKRDEPKAEEPKIEDKRPPVREEKKEEMIKLSLKTKIKGAIFGSVKLGDAEVDRFLETLKISMLQSDVSFDATDAILNELDSELKGKSISTKDINGEITKIVRDSFFKLLETERPKIELFSYVKGMVSENKAPVKILFLGPNGTGKTTTIAKLAHHFKGIGVSVVLSASDTFRAAAIEQIEFHANKLGVPIIKSTYGADPASIAFDAVSYAKAHKIDVVLIDSAGRQETNKSLINEIQKMVRVAKPDIIIFVGESTAGNMISEQVKEFNKFMKLNGIILTKLDCDAKGGGAISIAHSTGVPVLFFGVGEGYDALMPYNPELIVNAILPSA